MAVWSEVSTTSVVTAGRLDSEFFRKDYLDSIGIIRKSGSIKLKNINLKIVSGPFGSSLKSSEYTSEGIPFIRISDLENFFIKKTDLVYISEHSNSKIKGSQLFTSDLVLSKVGNSIGIVSILDEEFSRVNISENNIGIRFGANVDPEIKSFLVVYLNSKYGQNEILRRRSGNAQPKLNVSDIYDLEMPNISSNDKNYIHEIVTKIKHLTKSSQSLYNQAQQTLERELGLDKLVFDKPLSYEARLSEVVGNNRADADYYQIPFRSLGNHLKNFNTIPLGKMATIIKGIEVGSDSYVESGIPFLRVSNIKEKGISLGNSDKYISSRLYSALKCYQPQVGELLLTKDGTPGVCYTVTDEIEGIVSGGIVRLQLHDNSFPKEYLSLVVNSRICKMQIDQECSGALIVHWKPNLIRKLKIPVLSDSTMKELGRLVSESKKALTESRQLLEQAKRRVEELIEQAVQK